MSMMSSELLILPASFLKPYARRLPRPNHVDAVALALRDQLQNEVERVPQDRLCPITLDSVSTHELAPHLPTPV